MITVTKTYNVRNPNSINSVIDLNARLALNACSASPDAPVEFDGIPSRSPTPEERMKAGRNAPAWKLPKPKRDTAEFLKTLVCPL